MKKIRVLIAILGLDQHEVGAISVSRALVGAGMEVIYVGRFNLPPMIVTVALQESVEVIGISCGSWEYLHYVPELMELLKENELETRIIVGGPIITPGDERALKEMGVAAVFGPSSTTEAVIEEVSKLVVDQER